jgi:hypothetical protein
MAGVSVEARAAINGVVPTLTAEADPEVLIKVAESGDISRRHRYGFSVQRRNPESSQRTTRTFEDRSETPRSVSVAEKGTPFDHRDYISTGTDTGHVQDVREDSVLWRGATNRHKVASLLPTRSRGLDHLYSLSLFTGSLQDLQRPYLHGVPHSNTSTGRSCWHGRNSLFSAEIPPMRLARDMPRDWQISQ